MSEDEADADTPMSSPMPGAASGNDSISYASILLNKNCSGNMAAEDFVFSDQDCVISQGHHGMNINFADNVLAAFNSQWKSAVIINLIGKPNSVNTYDFILRSLQRKWKSKGGWKLIDLLNDYFIVKFELETDMDEILCGGPWILAGQTLVVRKWREDFDARTDKIGSMAVWTRIIGLPIRYFNKFALSMIGKILGPVVKVDNVTLKQERGRFARICIEINLDKPLKPTIEVDGKEFSIQYEGLSLICFSCGMYGHAKDKCSSLNHTPATQANVDNPTAPGVHDNLHDHAEAADVQVQNSSQEKTITNTADNAKLVQNKSRTNIPEDGFGPWMLIDYKARKKTSQKSDSRETKNPNGSRFNVLQTINSEDPTADMVEAAPTSIIADDSSSHGQSPNTNKKSNTPKPHGKSEAGSSGTKSVPEIIQMWSCLQSKIKERSVLGKGSYLDKAIDAADISQQKIAPFIEPPLPGKIGKDFSAPNLATCSASSDAKKSPKFKAVNSCEKINPRAKSSRKNSKAGAMVPFDPPTANNIFSKKLLCADMPGQPPAIFPGFFGKNTPDDMTISSTIPIKDTSMSDNNLPHNFNDADIIDSAHMATDEANEECPQTI